MTTAAKKLPLVLNSSIRGFGPSATLRINEHSNSLIAAGRDVVKFGLGQSPFPVPDAMVEALREHAHEKDYLPVMGLRELREDAAAFVSETRGVSRSADNVLVGPGTKELLFILQLTFNGELMLPNPSWVSYAPQAKIASRELHWLPTSLEDGWVLRPETLEQHLLDADPTEVVPRILLLNSPSNPTGRAHSASELEALADVCRRHGVLVLADEIYAETHFGNNPEAGREPHVSIAKFYPEGTVISDGISKGFGAGGWRVGFHVFPPELARLQRAMAAVASETYSSVAAPIQHAARAALRPSADTRTYCALSQRILRHVGEWSARTLRQSGAAVLDPLGGFYMFPVWARHRDALAASRGVTSSQELAAAVLEDTGVAFLPGNEFGRPSDELSARLAFVDFDGGAALQHASALPVEAGTPESEAWLREHCPRVVDGMSRVAEWTRKHAQGSG